MTEHDLRSSLRTTAMRLGVSPPTSVPANAPEWRKRFVLSAKSAQPSVCVTGRVDDPKVEAMVVDACAALDAGGVPSLIDDGLGGTYLIDDTRGSHRSVFKPCDEEPCACNNPKRERSNSSGLQVQVGGSGLKDGVVVGEAAFNEQAAYLLDASDRSKGFSRVPPTTIVMTEHSAFFDVMSGEGSS